MTVDHVVDTAGGMVQSWDAQELSATHWPSSLLYQIRLMSVCVSEIILHLG